MTDQASKKGLDFRQILTVFGRILAIRIGIRFWGFGKLYRRLHTHTERFQNRVTDDGSRLDRARHVSDIVCRVNRDYLLFRAECMVESLALWWLLRCYGIDSDLRLGVRTITGRFESHAWVEYQGVVLNDIDRIGIIYTPMGTVDFQFEQQGS